MIEYTWEILSLYTAPQENKRNNVVKMVNWRYQATEDSYFGDHYGTTELDDPNPNSKTYIKYDDLTEETIINWIKSKLDFDDLVKTVNNKLAENKNPKIIEKSVPWSNPHHLTGEEQYLVVIDDQPNIQNKTWGPLSWDSDRINMGLKERGFASLSVPDNVIVYRKGLIPIDQPLVLSDRVKIYRVDFNPQPTFDQVFEYNEGQTWVTSTGRAVGTYFVFEKPIEKIKEEFKEFVRKRRNNKFFIPAKMTLSGKEISTYTDSQTYLLAKNKAASMSDTDTVIWKLVGSWINANKKDLIQISDFVNSKMQEYYDEEYNFCIEVYKCETIGQLRDFYKEFINKP